jgi:hypothetical protein
VFASLSLVGVAHEEGRFVKSVVAASALVFLMAGPACAQQMPCKTFDRSSTDAPQFVRDYLDGDSNGLFVSQCGVDDRRQYYGASDLLRDGNICRYSIYVLDLLPTTRSRLERKEAPPVSYMVVSQSKECPSPQATHYVWTDQVPLDVFEQLVRVWYDTISSLASFDSAVSALSAADNWRRQARSRLRNVMLQGRSDRLAVLMVHRGLGLRKGYDESYELHVADPDHFDRDYTVTVSRFGWAYAITDVSPGIF